MSLLETAEAQSLLAQGTLAASTVEACAGRLGAHLERYLPLFYRKEQAGNAQVVVRGLLSGLERKTCEPIAAKEGLHRKPIQFFVGNGKWNDEAVMEELRTHVREQIGEADGVLVLDPSSFPKKGVNSCGVKRQWCGRLGKIENCQTGVFMAYASSKGHALVDRKLFLPEDWAHDMARREKSHVPPDVIYQEKWRIARDMIERHGAELPHAFVLGDDELGRPVEFRAWLREHGEHYILDVPCNTLVRDLEAKRPRRRKAGRGQKRRRAFVSVKDWAEAQGGRWQHFTARDGEKGPLRVMAIETRVACKRERRIGDEERLIVIRSVGSEPRTWYVLSNAGPDVPLIEIVRAHALRFRIEQLFLEGKGEAGLDHYEVRSWVGWHHHMTLSILALWILQLEKRELGGKKPGHHRAAGAPSDHRVAFAASA